MKINLKAILFTFTLSIHTNLPGQNLSFFAGLNGTVLHDYHSFEGHYRSDYQSGLGYSLGIGLDRIKWFWRNIPFNFKFERYGAQLSAGDGGLGGGYSVDARVDKSILTLGIYPLNFRIKQNFKLSIGTEMAYLLAEQLQGKYGSWIGGQTPRETTLVEKYPHYSRKTYLGLGANLSYDWSISPSLVVAPYYTYYFGLSNEFREFPNITKAMRHTVGLALRKR
ncbi:hypothetical protein [Haliscomenobacter sp.]|uniref:hypothetical protein n=1 Tax=Haliscomenobacter sp. TaxID=2717303 RepID=UPI00359429FD